MFSHARYRFREPRLPNDISSKKGKHDFFRLISYIIVSSAVFTFIVFLIFPEVVVKLLMVLAFIVIFIVVIYYIYALVPPYVVVTDRHIYYGLTDDTATTWKYKNIHHCEFSVITSGQMTYDVLTIETKKRRRSEILLPSSQLAEELRAFLKTRGVNVTE